MDGFILLDKPLGMRSSQAAVLAGHALGARKAGHSGTLDPGATGVLVVALDGAAKLLGRLMSLDKEYDGVIKLHSDVPAARIAETAKAFVGEVTQLPPRKSAVARKERVKRVYSFDVVRASGREISFHLRCESGFYVRKLAHDFGLRLGTRAQLWTLQRVAVGPFRISECVSLHEVGATAVISMAEVMARLGTCGDREVHTFTRLKVKAD